MKSKKKIHFSPEVPIDLTLNVIEDLIQICYYAYKECSQTKIKEKANLYYDLLDDLELEIFRSKTK